MIIPFTRSTEMKMAYSEKDIIRIINNIPLYNGNYFKSEDPYEHYDAENFDSIIEIKIRSKKYDKQIIERYKYLRNKEESQKSSRNFYYLTNFEDYISIWDITYLDSIGYRYFWHVKDLVRSTKFQDKEPIPKIVGYLEPQLGVHIKIPKNHY